MQERQERQVRSLGLEDPLQEEMATHSSILTWKIPQTRGAWQAAVCFCCPVPQSCRTLETLWNIARQAPLSIGFSRPKYCSGLPFPFLGIFPIQGSNLVLLHCRRSPALQVDSLLTGPPGNSSWGHKGQTRLSTHIYTNTHKVLKVFINKLLCSNMIY